MRISPSLEGIPASVEGGQRRYTSRLMARSGTGGRHDVAQVLLWCLLHIPAAIQAATPTGQDVLFGEWWQCSAVTCMGVCWEQASWPSGVRLQPLRWVELSSCQ